MSDPVIALDSAMTGLPPLLRIALWAAVSASLSMAIYAKLSPQKKLIATKAEQKTTRAALLKYDGEWDGMQRLIKKDLSLSLKALGLVIIPFAVSVTPIAWVMYRLSEIYSDAYINFGPEWMHGFDFCYIMVAVIVSLIIKITFKIA